MFEAVVLFDDDTSFVKFYGADGWVPRIAAIFLAVLSMNVMGLVPLLVLQPATLV